MRVLIIKLSSMGDLMHAMPALTDAANVYPDIEFDWVVDQAFAEVPLWHPKVKRVIKTAHRKWRKAPFKAWRNGELKAFYQQLNLEPYDVVVDLQSNLKSAVVSWLHKGDVSGLDKDYCREKPAHWAYTYRYQVDLTQHSVEKLRDLMAAALSYKKPATAAEYAIDLASYSLPKLAFNLPEKYVLFVHNASWLTKLWPLRSWQALVKKAVAAGYSVLVPCGNEQEYQRAVQIASVAEQAYALPRMSLNEVAALTHHASAAVCSDTGLAHLAALAGLPALTIYGATDVNLIGTLGANQYHQLSDADCSPCYKRQCPLEQSVNGEPVCMLQISAETVWHRLQTILPAQ